MNAHTKFYILKLFIECPESLSTAPNKKAGITQLFFLQLLPLRGFLCVIYNGYRAVYRAYSTPRRNPYRNASAYYRRS